MYYPPPFITLPVFTDHFICQTLAHLVHCITNDLDYYKPGIKSLCKELSIARKDVSNEYDYQVFYTTKHIFVLGKNRFIPQYRSGSFCPKPWPGADKYHKVKGLRCVENLEVCTKRAKIKYLLVFADFLIII